MFRALYTFSSSTKLTYILNRMAERVYMCIYIYIYIGETEQSPDCYLSEMFAMLSGLVSVVAVERRDANYGM